MNTDLRLACCMFDVVENNPTISRLSCSIAANENLWAIGKPHEVAKLQEQTLDWNWGLSPDGTSIAAVTFGATDNRIRLLSLSGQPTRELVVKNWYGFRSVDWAADSKGLFVASNPAGSRQSLLYVDLAGNAHPLWQVNSIWPSWAVPSRNGKYVAIPAPNVGSNVWMAENF